MEEPMMTEEQRDELKSLCQKADVPDKSGELLTQEGAQHFIDELREQIAERKWTQKKPLGGVSPLAAFFVRFIVSLKAQPEQAKVQPELWDLEPSVRDWLRGGLSMSLLS
jgi:hypothetical protein